MKRQWLKSLLALAAVAAFGTAAAQERTLKMNLNGPETHPAAAGMKKFADTVAAKTNGRIKIEANYVIPLEFPGYTYSWEFKHFVDRPVFII